ncbi:MAG: diguanylate cyclase [Clostridiales bacterium]|nr:diguanylate cyclase [Clostridiales bacterium]
MKQIQFEYENDSSLRQELNRIDKWRMKNGASCMLFHVFSDTLEVEKVRHVCSLIEFTLPDAVYAGCTTNGNVSNGLLSDAHIIITCTVFEDPSSKVTAIQLPLTDETEPQVSEAIADIVKQHEWVKAIELLVTIRGLSMTKFCEDLSCIKEDVKIFGGGALSNDINNESSFVFSSGADCSEHAAVFILIGGENLSIYTEWVTGWRPLGRRLKITRADHAILNELDNKPAYDTYYKYLNIANDEHFFQHTLEFPFMYKHNEVNLLRAPTACLPDGSLIMSADVEEGVETYMAYGDPWIILENVNGAGERLSDFEPQAIYLFSCAARRAFWGNEGSNRETSPFQDIASTTGFYTSGEFMRTGRDLNLHNVTLAIVGLREGPASGMAHNFRIKDHTLDGQASLVNRLANFVHAATEELEETNRMLELSSITDGLTKLLNRTEIQHRITASNKKHTDTPDQVPAPSLIMLDIDDFKKVNDTFGHREGDNVLRTLSHIMTDECAKADPDISIGRWGGEEFMILIPNTLPYEPQELAEVIRKAFSACVFEVSGSHTISLGVTTGITGEHVDILCGRVDDALYEAKRSGKDRVVIK